MVGILLFMASIDVPTLVIVLLLVSVLAATFYYLSKSIFKKVLKPEVRKYATWLAILSSFLLTSLGIASLIFLLIQSL